MDRSGDHLSAREAAERLGYTYHYFIQLLNQEDTAAFKDARGHWRVPLEMLGSFRVYNRITPEIENEIIRRVEAGEQQKIISEDIGLPRATVSAAVTRGYQRQSRAKSSSVGSEYKAGSPMPDHRLLEEKRDPEVAAALQRSNAYDAADALKLSWLPEAERPQMRALMADYFSRWIRDSRYASPTRQRQIRGQLKSRGVDVDPEVDDGIIRAPMDPQEF